MQIEQSASQLKKNYLWNTVASFTNALSSACLLLACARILGTVPAGIFSLAFALSQQFQVIGHFEIRSFQATDAEERFSFATYLGARYLSCGCMVLAIVAYTLVMRGFSAETLTIMFIMLLRVFDAFEDVFHGMFQQRGRLDIAGKAFFFRVLSMMLAFCVVAALTLDLTSSAIAALAASALSCFVCNIIPARRFVSLKPSFSLIDIRQLLWACFPLFCGSFMLIYITNAPKYAIDAYLDPEFQALYSYIFMPSLVINLLSGFVFKPLLSEMAATYKNHQITRFMSIITKGFVAVGIATAFTMVIAWFLGTPVLGVLYDTELDSYTFELMVLLAGGLFNALGIILYYGIVTMRHQKVIYVVYGAACTFCYAASHLVQQYKLLGAAVLYDGAMFVCALGFLCALVYFLHKDNRTYEKIADADINHAAEKGANDENFVGNANDNLLNEDADA